MRKSEIIHLEMQTLLSASLLKCWFGFMVRYTPNFYVAIYLFRMVRLLRGNTRKTNRAVSSCELHLHNKRGNDPLDKINCENELS